MSVRSRVATFPFLLLLCTSRAGVDGADAARVACADRLQEDEPVTTVPTIGFNVETLQYKNVKFQVWDLGGQVRAQ